ncbi:MAG: carboxylating nicotinate-nucleotide diphosphorylase [Chloroflexi bacterium]|nr:carboxylating nicotinate-nucleotide diphosphorylase [Chloroflexota bacterium]
MESRKLNANLELLESQIEAAVDAALAEDLGLGDVTTRALLPPDLTGKGVVLAKEAGVLCGLPVAACVFRNVDSTVSFKPALSDGSRVRPGDVCATVEGTLASILMAERVALNFLQRLSGVATATAGYVAEVTGTKATVVDTRKTTPGLRLLEKYAVRVGGGRNHRFHLGDGVLIKDNHLAALRAEGKGIKEAVALARHAAPHTLKIETEVEDIAEAKEALEAGADVILLDNMPTEEMRRVVEVVAGRALLEASGGITLDNVRAVAQTGVDLISIGALTHSVKALDISLEIS